MQVETQLENDGLLWSGERKWIVYQRGERRDPSCYEDIELIGRKVQKTLAEVVAERHGLPAMQVAALINERTAQRLIENWDRVFPNGTWSLDLDGLSSALLSLAFDETGPLSPKSAVLRFLSDPSRLMEVLQSQGLVGTFVHVIRTQLCFGRLPEGDTIKPSVQVDLSQTSRERPRGAGVGSSGADYLQARMRCPSPPFIYIARKSSRSGRMYRDQRFCRLSPLEEPHRWHAGPRANAATYGTMAYKRRPCRRPMRVCPPV